MVTLGDGAHKQRIDSERNQGRAPDMDWLDHDRLGFNYRLSEIACAIGLAQLERLDGMLAERARVAAAYREALARDRGARAALPGRGRERARLVRLHRLAAARERPRGDDPGAARARHPEQALPAGDPPDELLPRDASATGAANFPVCEDVAARSLALPFFPQMGDGDVERVSAALAAALGRDLDWLDCDVALLGAPAPRLPGDQRIDRVRPPAVAA